MVAFAKSVKTSPSFNGLLLSNLPQDLYFRGDGEKFSLSFGR